MNKYSKRALKTTATIGMSLAMVLSGVAAPLTNVKAADYTCDASVATQTITLENFYTDVIKLEKIKESQPNTIVKLNVLASKAYAADALFEDFKLLNAITAVGATTGSGTITVADAQKLPVTIGSKVKLQIQKAGAGAYADVIVGTKIEITDNLKFVVSEGIDKDEKITTEEVVLFDLLNSAHTSAFYVKLAFSDIATTLTKIEGNCSGTVRADAKYLSNLKTDVAKMTGSLTTFASKYNVIDELNKDTIKQAENDLKSLTDFTSSMNLSDDAQYAYADVKATLTNLVDAYYGNESVSSTKLETFMKKHEAKLKAFTKNGSILDGETVTVYEKAIKDIKADDDYKYVKESEQVVGLIDSYQEIIDGMKAVADLNKTTTNESLKAFNSTTTLNKKDYGFAVKSFMHTSTSNTITDANKYIIDNTDENIYAIYEAVKAETLDMLSTYSSVKYGTKYSSAAKVDKDGDLGAFTTDANVVMIENMLANAGFFRTVDTNTGLTPAMELEARMTDVREAWKNVTKDVEKLTAKNITSKDRATLVAADKALAKLSKDFSNNLTPDQSVELRAVSRNIENLFNALSEKGDTALVGWYDMGNGDYGFNNEDGTPAAYKWIASGSNWYFVRDGKMARNTWLAANSTDWYYLGSDGKMATSVTVDGCWINSLGIYKK